MYGCACKYVALSIVHASAGGDGHEDSNNTS